MYLLDTNVISELRRIDKGRANPNVVRWFESVALTKCFTASVVLLEIEIGVARLQHRDRRQGDMIRRWIDEFVTPNFGHQVLDFDTDAAMATAPMHVPVDAPYKDSMIAGIALVHDFTAVTRNGSDFERFGVRILNPWKVAV